jgi:hypothetical protein
MSGSTVYNDEGNYGAQGIPDESSRPPYRCNAYGWIDLNGNLLLFGGLGYGNQS